MRSFASVMALLPATLLLAACQKDSDPGPGGVTVGESRALDEAAEMLEKRPAPPLMDAMVPTEAAPSETAAAPKPAVKPKP